MPHSALTRVPDVNSSPRRVEEHRLSPEGELFEAQERIRALETKVEALESFTKIASHDLLAPLRRIQAFSEILRRTLVVARPEPVSSPATSSPVTSSSLTSPLSSPASLRVVRALSAINESVLDAQGLVQRLLELASATEQPLHPRRVLLEALVSEVKSRLVDSMPSGRRVEWCIDSLPEVDGDETLLRSMFGHLLDNALKYTRHRDIARIEIRTHSSGADGQVTLEVADNGVGFGDGKPSQLFRPFSRLHPASQFEGHGIGLATVRQIAERHGGTAWAETRSDGGARIFVSLRANHPATDGAPRGESA